MPSDPPLDAGTCSATTFRPGLASAAQAEAGLRLRLRLGHEVDDRLGLSGAEARLVLGLRLRLVERQRLVLDFRHELDVLDARAGSLCERRRIRDRESRSR